MTIGKNIADLRKNRGMTQEQLADILGVSSQTISKWENEVTMPDIMLLPVIAGKKRQPLFYLHNILRKK